MHTPPRAAIRLAVCRRAAALQTDIVIISIVTIIIIIMIMIINIIIIVTIIVIVMIMFICMPRFLVRLILWCFVTVVCLWA